jgi:nitrogen fixation NifU-like protein
MADDASLSALYQELILDHYRRPRNKGSITEPDSSVMMKNPLCGDEIELQLRFDGDTIGDVKFTGQGCSISQASASMMTELVKGKASSDAVRLRETFRAMVMGDATAAEDKALGRARAFSGVAKYPARVKCALLGWNALEEGVRQRADDEAIARTTRTIACDAHDTDHTP